MSHKVGGKRLGFLLTMYTFKDLHTLLSLWKRQIYRSNIFNFNFFPLSLSLPITSTLYVGNCVFVFSFQSDTSCYFLPYQMSSIRLKSAGQSVCFIMANNHGVFLSS